MGRNKDLTGMRFGKLIALRRAEDHICPSGRKQVQWECSCDCGNVVVAYAECLTRGSSKSCGCYRVEKFIERNTIHGDKKFGQETRLYNIWKLMKSRCDNPNRKGYQNYGGRGITYVTEWKEYKNFKNWALLNGYSDNLTLDRIDCNGKYEPSNCRWVDYLVQENNKTNNHIIELNGIRHTLAEWERINNLPRGIIARRICDGWDESRAIIEPVQKTFCLGADVC